MSNASEPKVAVSDLDKQTQLELEAAAFRQLVAHFQKETEVQNIDLMILSGMCRNCLSKWYDGAAKEKGIELDYENVREMVYGMPFAEWKEKHMTDASPEQLAAMKARTGH
jgi:hypothetical protein